MVEMSKLSVPYLKSYFCSFTLPLFYPLFDAAISHTEISLYDSHSKINKIKLFEMICLILNLALFKQRR